jgi:hypothetical protein
MGCHAFKLLHYTILMLLAAAAAAPGTNATAAAAADGVTRPGPVCRLHLEGFGDRPGIKKAQLSCTRGSITAAARPELLKALGSGTTGVLWSKADACLDAVNNEKCMLAVCLASTATFDRPVITALQSLWPDGGSTLCITAGSNVALVNGTFLQGLDMRPLRIYGRGTTAVIKQCRFQGNTVAPSGSDGGALVVADTAKVTILSSSFISNAADVGGAVVAEGSAQVNLTSEKTPGEYHICSSPFGKVPIQPSTAVSPITSPYLSCLGPTWLEANRPCAFATQVIDWLNLKPITCPPPPDTPRNSKLSAGAPSTQKPYSRHQTLTHTQNPDTPALHPLTAGLVGWGAL